MSDLMWERMRKHLPLPNKTGRPRADDRQVVEGILWVLKTGARWRDLPETFPSPTTCWRRLKDWEEQEVWLRLWRSFLKELDAQGRLDGEEVFMDGTLTPAQKGGSWSGN